MLWKRQQRLSVDVRMSLQRNHVHDLRHREPTGHAHRGLHGSRVAGRLRFVHQEQHRLLGRMLYEHDLRRRNAESWGLLQRNGRLLRELGRKRGLGGQRRHGLRVRYPFDGHCVPVVHSAELLRAALDLRKRGGLRVVRELRYRLHDRCVQKLVPERASFGSKHLFALSSCTITNCSTQCQ
jgi:hypothetical protein